LTDKNKAIPLPISAKTGTSEGSKQWCASRATVSFSGGIEIRVGKEGVHKLEV